MSKCKMSFVVILIFLAQLVMAGSAWADQIALSFSGGGVWSWTAATIGWEFSISEPINVTYLGVWDENGDGLTDDHEVGIWLSTGGAPLVSTVVTTASPLTNGFRYETITPYTLPAGTYVVGSYMPTAADEGASDATSYPTQAPVTYVRNLYLYDAGFTIPTDEWVGYDGGNFGANFQFVMVPTIQVPTMTQWGMIAFLMLAGFVSVLYLRRRSKV